MKTIYVLPQIDFDTPNFRQQHMARIEAAKTCSYRPQNASEYMSIEYMDRKLLMVSNIEFFNYCVELCKTIVENYVHQMVAFIADEYDVTHINTLDDLLRCGYMVSFIDKMENAEKKAQIMDEYRILRGLDENDEQIAESESYETIKKWFLNTFPQIEDFGKKYDALKAKREALLKKMAA